MRTPDKGDSFKLHGIRFYWNYDSLMYEAQVHPEDIEDVYGLGVESMMTDPDEDFECEINHIRDNPGNNKYTAFYDPEVAKKITDTARELVRNHYGETYDEAPNCPYCGTKRGFAMGTGDCGCEVDPE